MFTVVGLRNVVSKKDGTRYFEIHATSEDRFVNGLRCDTVFVREDMIDHVDCLALDSTIQIYYNRVGRVESVSVIL